MINLQKLICIGLVYITQNILENTVHNEIYLKKLSFIIVIYL